MTTVHAAPRELAKRNKYPVTAKSRGYHTTRVHLFLLLAPLVVVVVLMMIGLIVIGFFMYH
jgi:hypothetical protein